MVNKIRIFCLVFTGGALFSNYGFAQSDVDPLANPPSPAFSGQTAAPQPEQASSNFNIEVVVSDLQVPRSLVATPDGKLIVANGAGEIQIINQDGSVSEPIAGMPAIRSVGGRSLNDFVIDANFAENRLVYLTYAAPPEGEKGGPKTIEESRAAATEGRVFQVSKIARAKLSKDYSRLEDVKIISDIAGRRLIAAPDGTLYVTTQGHGEHRPEVQKLTSVVGKVLRINSDGSIPDNNPHANTKNVNQEVFGVGHRDPDGGFIHPETGELWISEHGPMGGDEINIIRPGQNSGWPEITYGKNYDGTEIAGTEKEGMVQPLYYWFPSVAPSSLMMYTGELFPEWQGDVFLGTMSPTQGKFIARLEMDGEKVVSEEHLLVSRDRRVRALTQGTDGAVYVLTDSENNNQANRHFSGEVLKLSPR